MTPNLLLVNGDSYSATQLQHKVYSYFIAEDLGIESVNIAKQGSNNDRIFRSTVEAVLDLLAQGHRPMVIVGLSFIRREEVWLTDIDSIMSARVKEQYPRITNDSQILPTATLDWVVSDPRWKKQFQHLVIEDFYIHKKLLDFYTNVFLLTSFLRLHQLPYLIFSAAKNTESPVESFPAIDNLQLVKEVIKDPFVIDLHTHHVMEWAKNNDPKANKTTGHLSEDGHRKYATWLLDILKEKHGT